MKMKIKILYEDADILAIEKPSGVAVHPDGRHKEVTISDWFLKNYPETKEVGEALGEILRPGIVHRLDRETSGVLLLAKNQKAHQFLKEQFKNRETKKTYLAIVLGWPKENHGVIDKPIGRSPADFRRRLSGRGARGTLREAVTEYKVLEKIETKEGKKFSLLEVSPKTGRTHQIRVHLKFSNYPVVCDSLYSPKAPSPEGLTRLALHAESIEFKKLDGKTIKISSPIPEEFKKVLKLN